MEIISTRTFDAACEKVFAAFTDPKQLALWWGPDGFTNTIHEFDFRVGGAWRFTMHGPDGQNYENQKVFLEIVPAEKIAFQHEGPMHRFQMTMTYAAEGAKTRLTWRMVFEADERNENLRAFIVAANEQNFDRLAAHLSNTASP